MTTSRKEWFCSQYVVPPGCQLKYLGRKSKLLDESGERRIVETFSASILIFMAEEFVEDVLVTSVITKLASVLKVSWPHAEKLVRITLAHTDNPVVRKGRLFWSNPK